MIHRRVGRIFHSVIKSAWVRGPNSKRLRPRYHPPHQDALGEHDVAGLEVAVNEAPGMGELESLTDRLAYLNGAIEREPILIGLFQEVFDITATHDFRNQIRRVVFLTEIENGDDVGMYAQTAHCLGLS